MLKYILESKIGKVNSLSRRPDWKVEVKRNNKDETLVKFEWLEIRKTKRVEVIVEEIDLSKKVRKSKVKDNKVVKAVEEIKEVKQYVEGYDSCQRNKNCIEQLAGKLIPNSIPKKP